MAITTKHAKKLGVKIESSPRVYEAPDTLVPYTEFTVIDEYEAIQDESVDGDAFMDLPVQGTKKIEGTLAGIVDVNTIEPLLEAAFGAESSGVFTMATGSNDKTFSMVVTDAVKTNKYVGCVFKDFSLSSEPNGFLIFSGTVLGYTSSRDDTSFPSMSTTKGTRLVHHNAGGTNGYMRIADQTDALDSGDDQCIESMELNWNWNFDHQYCNQSQNTLQFKNIRAESGLSATFARHTADTALGWRDNDTQLQAEFYYYSAADATLKIEVTNFKMPSASVSDDDIAKVETESMIAKNGLDGSYVNSNMTTNSAIRITVVNS